ncbi:hypothetical protein ACQ4PT_012211 [Festuca glaucescens]
MAKKRKADAGIEEEDAPHAPKRNRASPIGLVKLYEFISEDQARAIEDMELDSLLHIKCHCLNNKLINWFASLHDKNTREFVIPGRGKIPLDEESVYRTLGLPYGTNPVVYSVDHEVEAFLGALLFPADGSTPMTSRVYQILKDMTDSGDAFKQTFVMYIISTVLSPTTRNRVSNRCYPMMANIVNVHTLQWCKFIANQLHDELSKGSASHACLFHLQLLYVDSLDVSGLDLDLPQARFASNIWSKEDIDKVLLADLQDNKFSYGKLELKSQFAIPYTLFGGAAGFTKWFDTYVDPSCSTEGNAGIDMANRFAKCAQGFVSDEPFSSAAAAARVTCSTSGQGNDAQTSSAAADAPRVTRSTRGQGKAAQTSIAATAPRVTHSTSGQGKIAQTSSLTVVKSPSLPPDDSFDGGNSDKDDSSSSSSNDSYDPDLFVCLPREKNKSQDGDAPVVSPSAASAKTVSPDIDLGVERVVHDAPSSIMASETVVDACTMLIEIVVAPASGGTIFPDMGLGGELVVDDAPSATMASEAVVDAATMATETLVAPGSGGTLSPDIGLGDAPSDTMESETLVALASGGTLAPDIGLGSEAKMRDSSVNADVNAVDVNKGSEVVASVDLGKKSPVTCVYKSTRPKKRLHSLADKDREIKSLVCNEKNIPKSRAHLPKNQAIRSSPRLAKLHSLASVNIPRATTSPLELDMSSPEVSPARVEVAAVIEAGPIDVHTTSVGGGALSSPPSDTGAFTLPELATQADAANETLAAAESNAAEAALSDHTVAEPAPAHCVQPDIPSVPCVQPRVDKECNIFVSAATLFKNVVPAVSSNVLFQEDHVEKAAVVEDDGPMMAVKYATFSHI